MKWISRAILWLMIVAAALLMALGPRPDAKIPPGRIVITYWEKWGADQAAAMKRIVDTFNDTVGAQKGIYVQYLSLTNVDRKTLTATAAGVPPDVAGLWERNVAPFAARGALLPLDQLAQSHGLNASHYKPVYWKACRYNNHLYALPSTPGVVALHYNKKIFYQNADKLRAAGLDPTRPPRTIAEFDRYAAALDYRDPRTGRLERAGYFTMEPGWYIVFTPVWFGGRIFDPETNRYTLRTPACIRAFDWIASYSRRQGADAISDFRSSMAATNSPQNAFFTGKVAMIQQGPWMANYIRYLKPDMSEELVPMSLENCLPRSVRPFNYDWAAAPFPAVAGSKGATICESDILVIPAGARHPRQAFEFIAYIQRQDVMERLCRSHCKNSPLAQTSEDWVYTHPNPYIDVFDKLAAGPNARTQPNSPIWETVNSELTAAADSVYLLSRTPVQALTIAQKRADELTRQFEHQESLRHRKMTP
jgi:ABC-type glycerol-3-phosphate transport system substrate-binding protein